jgi:predicted nucleotidyltransferase component of viral defense system
MKNMPASVRARLLNLARKQGIPFQRLLTLYNQEGLLHRIVSTEYENSIVLKGGLLFYQLQGMVARPTKDIDLLGEDESGSEATLRAILDAASSVDIDDGLEFDHD